MINEMDIVVHRRWNTCGWYVGCVGIEYRAPVVMPCSPLRSHPVWITVLNKSLKGFLKLSPFLHFNIKHTLIVAGLP